MADERDLLPLIDSCRADQAGRPNAADLAAAVAADPSLRPMADQLLSDRAALEMFARAQRFDGRVRAAMTDVAVPTGLAERILSQLASAPVAELRPAEAATIQSTGDQFASPSARWSAVGSARRLGRSVWSRRYWVAGGLATAAAVLLVVNWYGSAVHYSPEKLLAAVGQFDAARTPAEGVLLSQQQPPPGFPKSNRIVSAGEIRWRSVAGVLGRKGVAYDLRTATGVTATLYVVRIGGLPNAPQIDAHRLPAAPPANPQPASGGASMAAWQEHGRLYVLVVHGDDNSYRQLIAPRPAIAWQTPAWSIGVDLARAG